MADPVQVTTGFTWTAAGAWASFLALLGLLVRQWVPLKRLKKEADEKFRDDLAERVSSLEAKLDEKEKSHAAELAIMRHRLNNVTQCLDALLLLIEAAPEKASEAAEKIKRMRGEQMVAEAAEKGAVHAAKITAGKGDAE